MKTTYYDIVDENDTLLNKTASFDEVHKKGLFHRGVHCIVYTPDNEIVMQKRSANLSWHPSEIEISAGGGVDAGETPEQAIVRETYEELGLVVAPKQLRFLGKTKMHQRSKRFTSNFYLYSYAVCIPKNDLHFSMDPEETSAVFLITKRKLKKALLVHRIKRMGKITRLNKYWNFLLDSI